MQSNSSNESQGTSDKVEIIRELEEGFTGQACLVRTSKKMRWGGSYEGDKSGKTEYFVVSSTFAMFTGFETLVFPANEKGEVEDWGEIAGGRGISREEAIDSLKEMMSRKEK